MPTPVYPTPFVIRPAEDLLTDYPDLLRASQTLARNFAHGRLATDEALQQIGHALWQVLAADDAFAQAHTQSGTQILPLIIESDDAAIQQLPWETLYHPDHGFLGKASGFYADAPPHHPSGHLCAPHKRSAARAALYQPAR